MWNICCSPVGGCGWSRVDYTRKERLEPLSESTGSFYGTIGRQRSEFAQSMYNIQHSVTVLQWQVTSHPGLYSSWCGDSLYLGRGEPTVNSPRYVKPLIVKQSTLLKCATFYNGRRMGKTLTLPVCLNKATAGPAVYTDSPAKDVLVNGVRGSSRSSDFEWAS